ncbi:hypothetical protein P691DRAFT_362927 [Macrolepiota fuliginosa MF-IS2]|uniref:Uncharacterized protein n=1 Tax=Macrolepiota fuliginosa MF-IS2 TaxID=1400762 RepID=A0A9P6C005_9AGAR|nr:hypothetical protein P691DRAFT_362927 [Macrolepiota fuliginosa MF-IS2]
MSTSRNISAQRPTAADIESAALTSLHNSRQASLPRSSLSRSKVSRKQTPAAVPSVAPQRTNPQRRRPATSDATSTSSPAYKQALSFPSSSPLPGPSASPSTAGPVSSSLSRNTSLPASLFHNTPPSNNIPTRSSSASVSQTRPSLSFPSPPTPIVPSIPLRHATQHSAAPTSNFAPAIAAPSTPSSPYSILTRPPIDPNSSSKRLYAEHSPGAESFATASDPNLASHSAASTPAESNQCSLPLKQLLAKPANPSQIQSGDGPEVPSLTILHKRSVSATESTQYATSRRNSDIAAIELAAIRALRPRPSKPNVRDKKDNDGYHYRRATDNGSKQSLAEKGERKIKTHDVDESGWWPDWKSNGEKERNSRKEKPKAKLSDPSKTSEPRDPPLRGPRLSRSFSTSSLFKRAGLFQARNSTIRSMSPASRQSLSSQPLPSDISGSPSPVIFSDVSASKHV